jgi:two-component system phosphate regulon sensor histidine kinase PhoR
MSNQGEALKTSFLGKFFGNFFIRAFISYLLIIALVIILIYLFSQGTIRNYYFENVKTGLIQIGYSMKPKIHELYEQNKFEELDQLVKRLGKEIDVRITVINANGEVLADSLNNPNKMESHKDRPEIARAFGGEIQHATRFSTTMGEQMFYLSLPVEIRGDTQYVLRLSLYLRAIRELIQELKGKLVALLLVLFLLTLLISWYFSRGFSKPIKEIVAATREFASGNFETRIFIKKKDELGEMADSFNAMVEEQRILFNKLNESREELKAIISSMREGLLVINQEGKITLCNESFSAICGQGELVECSYWECLRIPGFEDYVKQAFEEDNSFNREVELDSKTFLVGFNRIKDMDKLVIIFRDITDFVRLEQMKKDFVVNLTHELKTPLTAIKGFVETLEEEEDIKNINYIDIIKRHTDRMNQIVSDLLILTELEEKNRSDFEFKVINFVEIVENILKIYREKIKEKNLALEVDIDKNLPVFEGEKFKIEQMFINLLDNAVKYTDQGKISLSVKKTEDINRIKIQIKNTGMPIPKECLPRLFERFYVVDKSRSRQLGGTGLGLSIVKHVVLLHDGEITVESGNDEGTIFTIYFPVT